MHQENDFGSKFSVWKVLPSFEGSGAKRVLCLEEHLCFDLKQNDNIFKNKFRLVKYEGASG